MKSAPKKTKKRGLGDLAKKITAALGVKPCGGCKKRAGVLNQFTDRLRK